ncbi:MAG: EF-hand domain-containing protein [Nitrosomonadales bacterium]|nr:EF-hand domain-containing protein [Nitrosomonadales bacterium]
MNKWILGFILVAMPCMALAAGKPDGKKTGNTNARVDQIFNSVDTNGDGKISKEESAQKVPAIAGNFDQIDTNHDGALSKKEFKAFWAAADKKRREFSQRLEQADVDKNGMLSKEEANALPNLSTRFDEIDSNHDGQLVIKEISDYLRAQASGSNASAPAGTAQ